MFLLDTNVVSELRKVSARRADPNVDRWARTLLAPSLFISVVTVMELETGVLLVERRDPSQGRILRAWIEDQVTPAFEGRILSIDTVVARRCAAMHVPDRRSDRDALIAATALVHGLTVATRNVADFAPTNVAVFNPWLEAA